MKIISLTSFNNYYGNELVDRCMRSGIKIDAIVCVGEHVNFNERRIFWEYTNYSEGMHLIDLEKYAIPLYIFKNINSNYAINKIVELQPDLLLQAGVGLIKKDLIDIPKIGIINSHPGLLPKYRGCMAVEWSIYNDDPLGATCHFIDEGTDTGPIICSKPMNLTKGMDYYTTRRLAFTHQLNVMIEGIHKIQKGFRYHDAEVQSEGIYHQVMDEQILGKVKERLKKKNYSHYFNLYADISSI